MAGLVIKPRSRILHGHDWVYATEVLKAFGGPKDGDVVSLKDGRDHLLGTAIGQRVGLVSVGDSRIYRWREGALEQLTDDVMDEVNRIRAERGLTESAA